MLWLVSVLAMGLITFLLRAAPTMLPKIWLKSTLLNALNFALPLCVMTLLVLTGLHWQTPLNAENGLLAAQVSALMLVLVSYRYWRNVFISMIVGVAALNLVLYWFQVA